MRLFLAEEAESTLDLVCLAKMKEGRWTLKDGAHDIVSTLVGDLGSASVFQKFSDIYDLREDTGKFGSCVISWVRFLQTCAIRLGLLFALRIQPRDESVSRPDQ